MRRNLGMTYHRQCLRVMLMVLPVLVLAGQGQASEGPRLLTALIAKDIIDHQPVHPAVVFPVSAGKVVCYTVFGEIREKTVIHHAWYFRDKLIARKKLVLEPPQWSTYSSVQLRDDDKGPWRVDILDPGNKVIATLRFSITD